MDKKDWFTAISISQAKFFQYKLEVETIIANCQDQAM